MKILLTLALMIAALPAHAESKMDRKLTRAEMQKLLPAYVEMVEASAANQLTADENQTFVSAGGDYAYGLFRGNKMIGLQALSAEQKIQMLEQALATLKEGSPASRNEDTARLIEGFKFADKAGKISCRLGYYRSSAVANERIVTCEDNQSQAGSGEGDDEGYADFRRFTLSIDASTLLPLSLLRLEHLIAG